MIHCENRGASYVLYRVGYRGSITPRLRRCVVRKVEDDEGRGSRGVKVRETDRRVCEISSMEYKKIEFII